MAVPTVGQYIQFSTDGAADIYHYRIGSSTPAKVGSYRWLPAGLVAADYEIMMEVESAGGGANMNIANSIGSTYWSTLNTTRFLGWTFLNTTAGLSDVKQGNYSTTAKIRFTIRKKNNVDDSITGVVTFVNNVTVEAPASNPPGEWKTIYASSGSSQGAVTKAFYLFPNGTASIATDSFYSTEGRWLEVGQNASDYEARWKSALTSTWGAWTSLATFRLVASIGAGAGTTSQADHNLEIRKVGQTGLYDSGTFTLRLTNTASPR